MSNKQVADKATKTSTKSTATKATTTAKKKTQPYYTIKELGLRARAGELYVAQIEAEFSHDEFLRAVIASLAKGNTPHDIHRCTIGKVYEQDIQIYANSATGTVSYTANIGTVEETPYKSYVKYYDDDLNKVVGREIIEFDSKTYWDEDTDCDDFSNTTIMCNGSDDRWASLFKWNLDGKHSVKPESLTKEQASTYSIDSCMVDKANEENKDAMLTEMSYSIDCDEIEDYQDELTDYSSRESLWLSKGYCADITYNGTTYTMMAFPFGKMTIGGDYITGRDVEEVVWSKTKWLSIATTVMLSLSIILSLTLRSLSIFIPFIIAMCMQLASVMVTRIVTDKIKYPSQIAKTNRLNKKLLKLGLPTL